MPTVTAKSRTGKMSIEIEQAHERDRPEILRLLRQRKIGSELHRVPISNYVVVRIDGVLIGCAGIDFYFKPGPDVAILTHVAVRKDFRHRGIGAALIKNRMQAARDGGACMIGLVSMYYHFNLYKRRGFRTCPRKDLPDELKQYWMFTSPRYMKCAAMWRHLP